jgi:hypothetical protein
MYLGATDAEILEAREGVLHFQATVPMTPEEKAATDGDIERLTEILAMKQHLPTPVPPSPEYVFNRAASDCAEVPRTGDADRAAALAAQGRHLAALTRQLATAEREKGGRRVLIRALKAQIARAAADIAALDHQASTGTALTGEEA